MKNKIYLVAIIIASYSITFSQTPIIANHEIAKLSLIPGNWIDSAKAKLHIAYGHTSHGSQLITGMEGLKNWKGSKYDFNNGGFNGALDMHDYAFAGASDLGNPDRTAWENATRNFLNNPANNEVNVVIWSWCGQVSSATQNDILTYLNLMSGLENDFPNVKFVYMTGHLDGTGISGNLNQRNEQIRNYCLSNGKILYDFNDIESCNPDGNYYLDKYANDNCDYDSDGNGSLDRNWAIDWQNSHTLNVDWFNCSAAHSQPLNGNLKAYAAWWLWAKLAGWEVVNNIDNLNYQALKDFRLDQNYPNPFNPTTKISWQSSIEGWQTLKAYDAIGNEVVTLVDEYKPSGLYEVEFDAASLSSGVYFYVLKAHDFLAVKRMLLMK